jgi:D-alanyl-lipoteichoic acid acyltransferase DltB (MBOAT superfamily)
VCENRPVLFNSIEFIFVFLPAVFVAFWFVWSYGSVPRNAVLLVASLLFYAWWDVRFLPLLLASIVANYSIGRLMLAHPAHRRAVVIAGVTLNLAALGYFKYVNFFVENIEALSGQSLDFARVVLPIGISFFTFTQIAYLIDASRGQAGEYSLLNYGLFVTFFPHLIAGPILHHREMMRQFDTSNRSELARNVAIGLSLFAVGLFKKTVLADTAAPYASPVFAAFDAGTGASTVEAWIGAFAYAFQIYFDFSGYSDMAVGLALMFGIDFPVNFVSPYKATSIIEFWRRWHVTLSRFLRDYLYIPLGGNRRGATRRYVNLAVTMLLGGLWHGASWNFVIWGGLHGVYLGINHAGAGRLRAAVGARQARLLGWALTFVAVTCAWVFFRATTLTGALGMLAAMFGFAPAFWPVSTAPSSLGHAAGFLLLSAVICTALPNMYQVLRDHQIGLVPPDAVGPARLRWTPSLASGALYGAIFIVALGFLFFTPNESPFLYFQF